jgi:hypothetical protein
VRAGADGRTVAQRLISVETEAGAATSAAGVLLEAVDGQGARAGLFARSGNRLTAVMLDGEEEAIEFDGRFVRIFAPDGSFDLNPGAGKLVMKGTAGKSVLFRDGGIAYWQGPASVPDGQESVSNATFAIGTAVPEEGCSLA